MNRRDFLATVPLTLTAEALGIPHVRASESAFRPSEAAAHAAPAPALSPSHGLGFASALRAAEAIRSLQPSAERLHLSAPRRSALLGERRGRGSVARGIPWDFARCSCSREGVLWCGGPSMHVGSLSLP